MIWENGKIFMGWRRCVLTHMLICPSLKVFYVEGSEFRVGGDYTHTHTHTHMHSHMHACTHTHARAHIHAPVTTVYCNSGGSAQ